MRRLVTARVAACVVAACSLTACGSPDDTVTILAASSLVDVMPQIVELAEQGNPDMRFEVSYAASSQIVQQLSAGIDADVAVLAGKGPLSALDSTLTTSDPRIVATNTLAIALAPGNPANVTGIDDLGRSDLSLVVCAEQVPCGEATAAMFDNAGITPNVASFEPDVRATLSKVAAGEADAGVVYVTDLVGQDLQVIKIPPAVQVTNAYPAFTIDDSRSGAAFVELLLANEAQEVLRDAGFGAP